MSIEPWLGDACSLVDAFRAGTISPTEALEASLHAIDRSDLNAFSFVDGDAARRAAATADVTQPFGDFPLGIKELESVAGWPYTQASLVFANDVADVDSTQVTRLRGASAVLVAQTTASEFGGINCTTTKLHGTTRNPWNPERTPEGSSGGSAAGLSASPFPPEPVCIRNYKSASEPPGRSYSPNRPPSLLLARSAAPSTSWV